MSVISGESKFGLDIGATTGGILVWDVFAPEEGPKRGALAGNYEGVGASATVGVAWAPIRWSAAPIAPSLCSRFRPKPRSASTSRSASSFDAAGRHVRRKPKSRRVDAERLTR
jgi:hypothetical protein